MSLANTIMVRLVFPRCTISFTKMTHEIAPCAQSIGVSKKMNRAPIKKLFYVQALLLLCLSGCVTPGTKESYDEFEGHTVQQSHSKTLAGHSLGDSAQFAVHAVKVTAENGSAEYLLRVEYYGFNTGWLFIESGESLHFLIDSERVHLAGEGSVGHREVGTDMLDNPCVEEKAVYSCDPELIRRIANAKEVRVKLEGSRGSVERHFDEKNFPAFREFVTKFIDTPTS